jgi:hypothetical protein
LYSKQIICGLPTILRDARVSDRAPAPGHRDVRIIPAVNASFPVRQSAFDLKTESLVERDRSLIALPRDQLDAQDVRALLLDAPQEFGEERLADAITLMVGMDGYGQFAQDVSEDLRAKRVSVNLADDLSAISLARHQNDAGIQRLFEEVIDVFISDLQGAPRQAAFDSGDGAVESRDFGLVIKPIFI